jgi:2-oxoglutarate ferredoxin oxidoreductase subunit alpha
LTRAKNQSKEVSKVVDQIATDEPSTTSTETLDKVVIRLAGDSGDGMQVAGSRFTDASALFGNDLSTLPSFPAEIRAPAGTLPGVSSFQVQIADFDILTAGDQPDCLVAMNPAALKKNLKDLRQAGPSSSTPTPSTSGTSTRPVTTRILSMTGPWTGSGSSGSRWTS